MIQHHSANPNDASAWSFTGAINTLRILAEFSGIPRPHHHAWPPYTEGIRFRLIKALFASNSRYASLMITELFTLDEQINRPGTSDGDNWRFRLPWTLSEIRADAHLNQTCKKFATLISITRRS